MLAVTPVHAFSRLLQAFYHPF